MDTNQQQHQSHLFTVRLWLENLGDGHAEWRGQVQHVLSGETHYFREWPTLLALLRAMCRSLNQSQIRSGESFKKCHCRTSKPIR